MEPHVALCSVVDVALARSISVSLLRRAAILAQNIEHFESKFRLRRQEHGISYTSLLLRRLAIDG